MNCNNFLMLLYCIHLETKMTHVYTFFLLQLIIHLEHRHLWCCIFVLYFIPGLGGGRGILTDSLKGKKGELKKHSIRTHNKNLVIL